jgi:hypothetical protein
MISQVIATLRVNIKSLAAESQIIKKAERRYKNEEIKASLRNHRCKEVRRESRITQLTMAAIKGRPYRQVERTAKTEPDWKKIIGKIDRHSKDYELKQQVGLWCAEAKEYFKSLE